MPLIAFMIIISLAGACLNQPTAGHNEHDLWSLRMAEAVMNRFDSLIHYNHPGKVKWQYDIAMLGQAIDKLGSVDERFSLYMQAFMDYFVREDGSIIGYRKNDYNLDHINPAKNLLTLYKRTGERKYLDAIQHVIRQLEEQPVTSAGGFWHKKRYPRQMWLDGVYMSSPFMAQCAKEFDQPQWFDTVARQITLIYEKTLDEESGLLYHAWDESKQQQWADPVSGCSPNFWGRAMGWYMMALVDVLDYFPQDHPGREEILVILNQVATALLRVRDPATGLWYQVLDQGGREGNYLEASCSSMFTYAFAKGAKKGYLPDRFGKDAEAAFASILQEFVILDGDGLVSLTNICGAAGLGGEPYRDGSYDYYIHEKIVKNDPKGVGPFILAAIELKR